MIWLLVIPAVYLITAVFALALTRAAQRGDQTQQQQLLEDHHAADRAQHEEAA